MKILLKSKIHRATVTECNVDYVGSISIDKKLMERANLVSGEQVHVANLENGNRLITYVIEGKDGEICLNGAAAHRFSRGDKVIIMAFEICDEIKSKTLLVDEANGFLKEI